MFLSLDLQHELDFVAVFLARNSEISKLKLAQHVMGSTYLKENLVYCAESWSE